MLSLNDLNDPQLLIERGWHKWSNKVDNEGKVLLLCPFVDFKNVPDGVIFESLTGSKKIKGKDLIDDDTHCGLIGFGIRA